MAQKVQVILVDDIDGGSAVETVSFGLDGTSYEIDLSSKNAAKLRDAFGPYVGAARKASGRGRAGAGSRGRGRGRSSSGDTGAIRDWARKNGYQVSDRGRISADVAAAYEKAH